MTSLTDLRRQARLTVQVLAIALVIFIGYKIITKIFRRTPAAPPIPPPTVQFGKLSYPKFEAVSVPLSSDVTYSLDLITPDLPTLSDRTNVYKQIAVTSSLFGPDRAKKIAQSYGFKNEPEISADSVYTWNDPDFPRTFQVNLLTREFTLMYDWKKNPDFITTGKILSESQVENLAIGMIQKSGIYPPEFAEGKRKVTFLKLVGGEIRGAKNAAEASLARVDFYRSQVDKLDAYTPDYLNGITSVILTNSTETKQQILMLNYHFVSYDYKLNTATYPIKTSQQAWQEIVSGAGVPVNFSIFNLDPNITFTPPPIKEVRVKQVFLGYYDSLTPQPYLEPVYVFDCEARLEGGKVGQYVLYLPAVIDTWLTKEALTTENSETPSQ